jgi:SAM-dependent methyltransferase
VHHVHRRRPGHRPDHRAGLKVTSTDHFSAHAAHYARHRPSYPPELFDWLAAQSPARELAWDCATGNGQAALALAEHFQRVQATDFSAEQLAQATPHPRVGYLQAPAEASGLVTQSCDLVTVAQALHWFCHERFFAEVRRVLKPGGLFAAWTYTLLHGDPDLTEIVRDYSTNTVGAWWPPERRWVDLGYRGMPFPCADIDVPGFEIRRELTLDEVLDYLRTWSSTQRCLKETGVDPCLALRARLQELWPAPEARKTIVWPIILRCGRVE